MSSPKFQRRHYNDIAETIREQFDNPPEFDNHDELSAWTNGVIDTTFKIAKMFKYDNPNFRPMQFYEVALGETVAMYEYTKRRI